MSAKMTDVKPIPEGFSTVTPYMTVSNCVEAIEFYGKAFGATQISRMEGPGGSTMHAEIRVGDSIVMMTDENAQFGMLSPLTLGNNTGSLHLYVDDVDAAFKKALDAGCEVIAPLMDMFWGDRFGKVKDPFGHGWSLASKKELLTAEQISERAAEAMKQMAEGGSCEPTE
jgi:PhnB protein